MATTAVALADGGEVDEVCGRNFGPGVGTDSDFSAEAGFGETDGVSRVGVKVVGDELVETFHGVVGDVKKYSPVAQLGAVFNQSDGLLVTLQQWRQQRRNEGLGKDVGQGKFSEQRDKAGDEEGVLRCLDDEGELHGGLGHFNGGLGRGVLGAIDDVGPVDEV